MSGTDEIPPAPGASGPPDAREPVSPVRRPDGDAQDSGGMRPAWLAPWVRPRPLLFSILFIAPLAWAVLWYVRAPAPSLPLSAGPGVTLATAELESEFGAEGALAIRSVAGQLESLGFRTDGDLAATAVLAGETIRLSFRLLVAESVPCFGELRTDDGGLPRLRLITVLANGGLVITSSRMREPTRTGDPRLGRARLVHVPAAGPSALLLRHQGELSRLGRNLPSDFDLSRSRYATIVSMMIAGGLR